MASSSRFWWLPFGRLPEISANELHADLARRPQPQVLDARTYLEWRTSRIENAVNAPITELRARIETLAFDPGRPVIAVCLSAHRSIPAVRALRAAGFEDARQLQGGMLVWWRAGLPVVGGP